MTWHPEVLAEAQRSVLAKLAPLVGERGFYLAGGTAVALQLGHRVSVDLDWFTSGRLDDPLGLAADLREQGLRSEAVTTDAGSLQMEVDGIRTTFLEYRYPLLRPLIEWPETGCRIASLEDLACTKLSAVAGRGARRDFLDLYVIVKSGIPLGHALELYSRKFDVSDTGHVLRSLVYFDDAEKETMSRILHELEWSAVRKAIERWVKECVDAPS